MMSLHQPRVLRLLMGSVNASRFKKADSALREYVGLDWDREVCSSKNCCFIFNFRNIILIISHNDESSNEFHNSG